EHRAGGQGNQGRQGGVPGRQDRDHSRAGGEGELPGAEPDRERARAGRQRREGEALGGQGQVPEERHHVVDDGARHHHRHDARDRSGEALMAVTRAEKQEELAGLESDFKGTESAILLDYKGLKVPEVTELRRQVRKVQASYKVVKNTLAKRALKGTPFESLTEHFAAP